MKLKNIKETFDNREIKPSASSWDQLASRLDEEEKKNKKPVMYWLGAVAAVLIAAVLLYPSLKNEVKVDGNNGNEIVITEPANPESLNSESVNTGTGTVHIDEVIKVEPNEMVTTEQAEKSQNEKDEVITSPSTQPFIAQIEKKQPTVQDTTHEPVSTQKPLEQSKSVYEEDNTAMAAVENKPVVKKQLTAEEEMELLLNQALNKVEVIETATATVNPDKLLRETEWDIQSDKRNSLQNSLEDGLNFLKAEAVAIVIRK